MEISLAPLTKGNLGRTPVTIGVASGKEKKRSEDEESDDDDDTDDHHHYHHHHRPLEKKKKRKRKSVTAQSALNQPCRLCPDKTQRDVNIKRNLKTVIQKNKVGNSSLCCCFPCS